MHIIYFWILPTVSLTEFKSCLCNLEMCAGAFCATHRLAWAVLLGLQNFESQLVLTFSGAMEMMTNLIKCYYISGIERKVKSEKKGNPVRCNLKGLFCKVAQSFHDYVWDWLIFELAPILPIRHFYNWKFTKAGNIFQHCVKLGSIK